MIQNKGKDLKYLQDFRNGKIKLGLGIGCDMDKHIRFKKGQLVIFMGHDNVGKTYFYTFYALCLALKHGTKFCFWTGENSSGNVMRDLIQMYEGKPFHEIPMSQIHSTYAYLEQFFEFVDNSKLYKPEELFEVFEKSDADACLIDPYTGLDRDMTHQGNYKFLNSAREFTNRTQKTVYVSSHPNSEAGRAGNVYPEGHEWAGHLKAPLKANIEGGKSFLNRTDDMFTVHRLVSSPTMKFETMVTVEKIKDRVTGGECTNLNEPLLFNFNNGNGFTQGHNNPLKNLRGGDEVVKTHTNTLRDFRKATSTEQDLQDFNF
tara:strand:+ start:1166 stop:2116 length:951 start_codon:yes stop_codon:yes gene_type:complete